MQSLPSNIEKLIEAFVRLPGIGPKTASRLVLFLLHSPAEYVNSFGKELLGLKEGVRFCRNCYNLSEEDLCAICRDEQRQAERILVVEDILDLLAFENIGEFKGLYHVLGGLISPMQGVGPEDLNVGRLLSRVRELLDTGSDVEVIIATNPNLEGEATAMYLRGELQNISDKIVVSRIARGVPTGADLDYADKVTLLRSLEGRVKI